MSAIPASWLKLFSALPEHHARWFAAEKAIELGRGGIERVHQATKLSRPTIARGVAELRRHGPLPHPGRIRKPGGGRNPIKPENRAVIRDLERILSESTAGDPMTPLKWTVKSTRTIAAELRRLGYEQSPMTVCRLLWQMGYSLQANRRTIEGGDHPDRDAQFRHITAQVKKHVKTGQPVVSVDAKKREYLGTFKNPGRTWRRKGDPIPANVYDYKDLASGVAVLYGLYDEQKNQGMVNVGVSHETGEFAAESLQIWWRRIGRRQYPKAKSLLICADGGGANSASNKLWKIGLQKFADATGLSVTVCHYPPGTSKWNKIEHRIFSQISMNWKGVQLRDYETVISLIGHTTNLTGLKVDAAFDDHEYPTGIKVAAADMASLNIKGHAFQPHWNYTIQPADQTIMDTRMAVSGG